MTTEYTSGTATMTTTEYSLAASSTSLPTKTDAGVYQLFLDTKNLAAADSYLLTYYETAKSGGTKGIMFQQTISGVQTAPVNVGPAFALMNGWDITVKKLLGANQSMDWSIRKA